MDPQITSLEVLYSILAKAFDIKSEFGISYKATNPSTQKADFLMILSDWDLDSAFLRYFSKISYVSPTNLSFSPELTTQPFSTIQIHV